MIPMPTMKRSPVEIVSDEIVLRGVLLTPGEEKGTLVVLVHGIPLSKPDPSDPGYPALADVICGEGCACLFVNMRGTGASGGDFHLGGWYRDLEAVVGEFAPMFEKRVLAGFSAGAALSIKYAATHHVLDGVASFAAPARLRDIFPRENLMAFIEVAREVGIIRNTRFPSTPDWFYDELTENEAIDFVADVSPTPLLLVHGEQDDLVPVENARGLFEAAGEPKELLLLTGGEHRLRHDNRVVPVFLEWMRGLGLLEASLLG